VIIRFFAVLAAATLEFENLIFLMVRRVKRINMRHSVEIWRFFKMAAAAILDFKNVEILGVAKVKRVKDVSPSKFRRDRLTSC